MSSTSANSRFTEGNPGGPGNPFARQTAALRTYLLNHVTKHLQDILEILLLNAKGGHLPSIKLLFSYVLGKPKPVVEPDLLDLQEMQMLQQSTTSPEALATLCDQLPLDLQVQLTRFTQTENVATAVQTPQDKAAAPPQTPPSAPSTDGDNGIAGETKREQPPSTNGKIQRPPRPPKLAGFDWLGDLRKAVGRPATT